jgi:hypothetical protein
MRYTTSSFGTCSKLTLKIKKPWLPSQAFFFGDPGMLSALPGIKPDTVAQFGACRCIAWHCIRVAVETVSKPRAVRCPYCVEHGQFKAMAAQSGGEWYMCGNCGHLALPSSTLFQCTCSKCTTLDRSRRRPF